MPTRYVWIYTKLCIRNCFLKHAHVVIMVKSDKGVEHFGQHLFMFWRASPPSSPPPLPWHSRSYEKCVASCKANIPGSATQNFLSNSSNSPFPHPVVAYFFFFPSLLPFVHQRVLEGCSYARCDQSSYSSFVLLFVGCSFPPYLYAIFLHFSQG